MTISATDGVGSSYFGGTATSSTSSSDATSSQVDKDMFLKLMVAQLKNQDPMNPQDSSQFLAQTAQFTSLEKLEAVAAQSAQALSAQLAFGATALVGKNVTYTDADGIQQTGAVSTVRFTAAGPVLGVAGTDVALGSVSSVVTG
ncbi:MAG: flagellar hook capping FlgD N-terminal domain-containing protein [Nocardioidaceae bacterium]